MSPPTKQSIDVSIALVNQTVDEHERKLHTLFTLYNKIKDRPPNWAWIVITILTSITTALITKAL